MPSLEGVYNAAQTINKVCKKTPLELNFMQVEKI